MEGRNYILLNILSLGPNRVHSTNKDSINILLINLLMHPTNAY